jgi:hypothetical protein
MRIVKSDPAAIPGYRNYLVYCDESGQSGKVYYGFGSLWMPWERRGDFTGLVSSLRQKHHYNHEIKWHKVDKHTTAIYCDLVEEFFRRNWLMFHCIVGRKGYIDKKYHRYGYDEAFRKQFALLIKNKIMFFSEGKRNKVYHVAVDPLPSSYEKADEAAHIIINNELKRELGFTPINTFTTRDSRETSGIQLADLLLGAVVSDWNRESVAEAKLRVKACIADHLGWNDLHADTWHREWKFNIWFFHDPTTCEAREAQTRPLELKYPVPPYRRHRQ